MTVLNLSYNFPVFNEKTFGLVYNLTVGGGSLMDFKFDLIQDKVEFFEAYDIKSLEKKINEQIEHNKAILLGVNHVSHQMHIDEDGRKFYSAVVHFKAK